MGTLHTATTFITVIGKMNGDGGLSDHLVERDVLAAFRHFWDSERSIVQSCHNTVQQ